MRASPFPVLIGCILTSCNMVHQLEETTHVIEQNQVAVTETTEAIYENQTAVSQSSEAIKGLNEIMEKSTALIQKNGEVITEATVAIDLNRVMVQRSTEAIEKNIETLEKATHFMQLLEPKGPLLYILAALFFTPLALTLYLISKLRKGV